MAASGLRRSALTVLARRGALALAALALTGCMPRVSLTVLEPGAVTLPDDVRTLAVIDRSAPKNAGQHVLGALEGLVTGEGIGADRQAASEAVDAVVGELAVSPRFDVVVPVSSARYVDANVFDTVLPWRLARRIARDADAQALVALEAIDSDSWVDVVTRERTEEDDNGRERTYLEYEATRRTEVLTSWRLYDPGRKLLLDDQRDMSWADSWTATGRSRRDAVSRLPPVRDTVMRVARLSGHRYGTRIAPHYVVHSRAWFAVGDPRLKEARGYVRADLWDDAAAIWSDLLRRSMDPKVRGKASHNLALYHEVHGRLAEAHDAAQQAVALLGRPATRRYLSTLQWRLAEQRRLDQQMRSLTAP